MQQKPETRLDFAFTEHDTPELRARIERDLGIAAQRVREADPHLEALVLTGGFSRGEGTARGDAPLNDYDFVAIRSRPGGRRHYAALGARLTREVGIEVDLLPVWRARLPLLGRKLFWLDLTLGGRVIHGAPDILSQIPRFDAADMRIDEAARLLGNRAAGLLLAVPGAQEPVDTTWAHLQATKAVLAAMDARLLASGCYAPTMRERLALARGMTDHDAFDIAVNWKLASQPADPGDEWWTRARDVLLRAVDDTGARWTQDTLVEHAFHLVESRRLRVSPSRALRVATWDILQQTSLREGPADPEAARRALARMGRVDARAWLDIKKRFFEIRAQTLQ